MSLSEGRCSPPHAIPVVRANDRFGEPLAGLLSFLYFPIFVLEKATTETTRVRVVVLRVLRVLRVFHTEYA
jgi:hypothetical protein